ncbi:MAG: hypothetical protein JXB23_18905 [Candidatus Aminicenantes bacterium]|nr:hypothetical protein [Candidatus Aminicenantes bacterium]
MKKTLCLFVAAVLFSGSVFAGVVKKTKSEVTFKGFGTYKSLQTEKIAPEKKLTDSKNEFKGKGIVGSLSGKFLLKSGDFGEIIDLTQMTIFDMDHRKKEYRVSPLNAPGKTEGVASEKEKKEEAVNEQESEKAESDIKITKSEFKVEKTGESRTINTFPAEKFVVTWVTQWENTRTGQKGTDRLLTDVWTTPLSGDLQKSREEENQFTREYMQKLDWHIDSTQQDILGTNWMTVFSGLGTENSSTRQDASKFASEMSKIKGYPVVIDGKYYTIREGGEAQKEKEEEASGLKGKLGAFAKKAIKKDSKNDTDEPSFSYYTELLEFAPVDVSDSEFTVPSNYKKKD